MGSFARAFVKRMARAFAGRQGRHGGIVLVPVAINGTFTDATGWALAGSCTIDTGSLHCANTAANVTNSYAISLPAGTYRINWEILAPFTAGNASVRLFAGSAIAGATRSAGADPAGAYVDDITVTAAVTALEVRVTRQGTTMDCRIDNITLNQIVQE